MYLSAVGSLHRRQGFKNPNHHNPQLKMVLRGARQANLDRTSYPRQLITRAVLHRLWCQVRYSHKLHEHDKHMLTAAFIGFLQVNEFTTPPRRDSTLGLIQTKPASHVNGNIMLSQSKHQKQTGCTGYKITYSALMRNFAHIQPCKSTLVTFPTPLQWEHSLCSHLELATHSPCTCSCLKHLHRFLHKAGYLP